MLVSNLHPSGATWISSESGPAKDDSDVSNKAAAAAINFIVKRQRQVAEAEVYYDPGFWIKPW